MNKHTKIYTHYNDDFSHIEIDGWSGQIFSCRREAFSTLYDEYKDQITRPGIYGLLSDTQVYFGQGENPLKRIEDHTKNKDFWYEFFILTMKDNTFNKAHIAYLEATLIKRAREANRYTTQNQSVPNLPYLARSDLDLMNTTLENVYFLDRKLRYFIFERPIPVDVKPYELTISDNLKLDENVTLLSPPPTDIPAVCLLSSSSIGDVLQVLEKGYWDHTKTIKRINVGGQIIVTANKKLRRESDETSIIAVRGIVDRIEEVEHESWVSNTQEGSEKKYRCRVHFMPGCLESLSKGNYETEYGDIK